MTTPNPLPEPVDTILEEIHQTRRKLLEEHGGIAGLAAYLRQLEAKIDHVVPAPDSSNGIDRSAFQARKPRDRNS